MSYYIPFSARRLTTHDTNPFWKPHFSFIFTLLDNMSLL
jgi:hypothetical protein